eukprot:1010272_1
MRASIDMCEIKGIIETLEDMEDYTHKIEQESIEMKPDRLIVAIDNLCVIQWINGINKINDPIVYDRIQYIHELIDRLDIQVYLIKIPAHKGHKGNEWADDLAKLAMTNLYQTRQWCDYVRRYSDEEWCNMTFNAVKNEAKRAALRRTQEQWKEEMNIVLVGQFAKSKYLRDMLQHQFPNKSFWSVNDAKSHLAVALGALYWVNSNVQ